MQTDAGCALNSPPSNLRSAVVRSQTVVELSLGTGYRLNDRRLPSFRRTGAMVIRPFDVEVALYGLRPFLSRVYVKPVVSNVVATCEIPDAFSFASSSVVRLSDRTSEKPVDVIGFKYTTTNLPFSIDQETSCFRATRYRPANVGSSASREVPLPLASKSRINPFPPTKPGGYPATGSTLPKSLLRGLAKPIHCALTLAALEPPGPVQVIV